MNVQDAAYNTVHDYPGGAEALAGRLGKRGTSLCHEVAQNMPHAKLGLLDAVKIMSMSGDIRMLHAQAAGLQCMVVPLPTFDSPDSATAAHIARVAQEFADVMCAVATGMADGVVTDNELRSIERHWGELIASGQPVLAQARAMNRRSTSASTTGA